MWLVVLEAIDCGETPNRSGGEEEVGEKRKTVGGAYGFICAEPAGNRLT